MKPNKNSLVLYKQSPALVTETGEKLTILLPGGKSRNVREKDVYTLHPGPVPAFPELEKAAPEGQPEEAWELLQGERPTLKELSELVYGEHTPSTAWLAFKLLNRSPWFRGTPEEIEVLDAKTVAERIETEKKKAEQEQQWEEFLHRFQQKKTDRKADELFLRDLEMYALGRSKGSRILKALGKKQSPENAHRVMLEFGACDDTWNPHPLRLEVPLDVPDYPLRPREQGEEQKEARLDLTDMEAFAIDDEGNTDPDDALSWDGKQLWVHIADVAGVIPAGSEADINARNRCASLYLPEKIVPMLPPEAAEKLGLGIQDVSPAMSYAFEIGKDSEVVNFSVHLTLVRVTRRTYEDVNKEIEREPFKTICRITEAHRKKREEAGAVFINMPEVKVTVNSSGAVAIEPLQDSVSRNMVSETMLMAGAYAAQMCKEKAIPIPYATQKIESRNARESVPSENMYVRQYNQRRGMSRSRITLECSPHEGLGLSAYSRITSPLRRYPDLIASRQVRAALLNQPVETEEAVLNAVSISETRLGSLIQAERRSNLFWKILWLSRKKEWAGEAWLVETDSHRGLFLIPELAMETAVQMKEKILLGSRVILKVKETNRFDLSVRFAIKEIPA